MNLSSTKAHKILLEYSVLGKAPPDNKLKFEVQNPLMGLQDWTKHTLVIASK